MGITYKAFDVDLHCPVTLKVISERYLGDESARLRFLREARVAARLRHSNVASVLHLGRTGNSYFYAMEFVEGETLERLIKRSGRIEITLALEIVTQVAAGLTAIHKQKLVHRDIKPSNIIVSLQDGKLESAKIIDLGLAKGVAEEDTLSTVGGFIGTTAYASPEQFAGIATDIRSDLYSLGITVWEMLSGQLPFQGSPAELMYEHQHGDPPIEKLKGVPTPVIALLQILLAKDPNQRFEGPIQLQNALTKVRESIGSGQRLTADELRKASGQVSDRLSKAKPRKQTLRWAVGSGLGVAAVAIAWFFFSGRSAFLFNQPANQTIPAEKSVAVLPFENIGPNKDDAYFADGVQDEILNNLAKIAQLKVISRTSVMKYRASTERDLRQIANALGVANVLEGTVRRDGNHVRVSTELVDARDDSTIWADSYDRDLTNIFAIQSEIAQTVASKLSTKLSREELKDIEEKPTNNLEAYDLYLQGKHLLETNYWILPSSEKEVYSKIITVLEEATKKDGEFALAYCLIAKAHDNLYIAYIDRTQDRRALGDEAINEALRIRPDLPEAHLALAAHLFYCYRDFERARVQIAIAAKNLSNSPDLLQLTAFIDRVQGRWETATLRLEKALSLDPQNPELLGNLADTYRRLRRYRDCDRIFDRLIALEPDQPGILLDKVFSTFEQNADLKSVRAACDVLPPSLRDDPTVRLERFYYAICARDFAAAKEILSNSQNEEMAFLNVVVPVQIVKLQLEFVQGNHPSMDEFGTAREQLYRKVEADSTDPFMWVVLALTDLALGQKEQAIQEAERALAMRPTSGDAYEGPFVARNVAIVYALADQPDPAFGQLNTLAQMPGGAVTYGDLRADPCWDRLRKDPRFDKLLAELAPRD
jgi:serine/threonine protein kinase/Tfp pilus assembly protein PilF